MNSNSRLVAVQWVLDLFIGRIAGSPESLLDLLEKVDLNSVFVADTTSTAIRVLVFAHVPPPHHGQSYMVSLLLKGLAAPSKVSGGSSTPILHWHVDARFSADISDIGGFRFQKALLVFRHIFQAICLQFRHRITHFYYVPAPGLRMPVIRDWLILGISRLFFRRLILHWHSVGLGEWIETPPNRWMQAPTRLVLNKADLSIVLSDYNRADAEKFHPRKLCVVSNGIPDPCPDYETRLQTIRSTRANCRVTALRPELGLEDAAGDTKTGMNEVGSGCQVIRVLFVALCTRDKGMFDAIDGVLEANRKLALGGLKPRFSLTLAGKFYTQADETDLQKVLENPEAQSVIHYRGFVSGADKTQLFEQSEIFCFPTYYGMEGQPVNLIEAMAFGLEVVATRWRSIPEMFPTDYPGLVEPRATQQVARALLSVACRDNSKMLRGRFESLYSVDSYVDNLKRALISV